MNKSVWYAEYDAILRDTCCHISQFFNPSTDACTERLGYEDAL